MCNCDLAIFLSFLSLHFGGITLAFIFVSLMYLVDTWIVFPHYFISLFLKVVGILMIIAIKNGQPNSILPAAPGLLQHQEGYYGILSAAG